MKLSIFFILFLFVPFNMHAQNSNWEEMPYTGSYVYPSVVYTDTIDDALYLGAAFRPNYNWPDSAIAKWNGNNWVGVGNDTTILNARITIFSMTTFNDKLFVGGIMHTHIPFSFRTLLAYWDNNHWDTLPISPFKYGEQSGNVWVLKVIDDKLFVGGIFDTVNGQHCESLAAWDGTQWEYYSIDFVNNNPNGNGFVGAIAKYKGTLYIGGNFSSGIAPIIEDTLMDIAQWTGTGWKSVDGGIKGNGVLDAMVIYKDELYVAGYFFKATGNAGNHIMKWDGEKWSDVGGGLWGGQVFEMEVHDGKLYVVGSFSEAGGVSAQYIAVWDGQNWCGLGSHFDNTIADLAFYHDTLIVAGGFWTIDGDSIYKVAKWLGGDYVAACGNTTAVEEQKVTKIKVFPNPATGWLNIQMPKNAISENTTYKIYNMQGKLVLHGSASQSPLQIDVANLPVGLYGCVLTNQTGSYTAKFVKR